jgi:hypothetical protein
VSGANLPYLLEHYKAPAPTADGEPWTATLFIPGDTLFSGWDRRAQVADFVRRYAPAHVHMRACFVSPKIFTDLVALAGGPVLPGDLIGPRVAAYAAAVATQQADLHALLCSVVSVVSHANGIHIWECIDEGRDIDRLDVGHLPTAE